MLRKIILATVMAAFVSAPAFAAVQNVKVSGNINSTYVNRDQFDFGAAGAANEFNQSVFITQTTLRVDADLSDNVQTVVQLVNERAWNNLENTTSANNDANIDINLAFVRMKELLYSPLTVEIGRMQLNYGNGLIIGNGANNSTYNTNPLAGVAADLANNTAFDTIRAILDYKPLTIDIFAAKVDANNVTGQQNSVGGFDDDVDLYGVNANYQLGDDMNSVIETYLFAQYSNNTDAGSGAKTDKIYVPGLRASTNPIGGLNFQGEVAWQKGTFAKSAGDNLQRDAFAAQAIANYQVKDENVEQYKPVLQGVYTFLSGDSNPQDSVYSAQRSSNVMTGWNAMYEGQGGGKIYNALFSLSNAHIVELSAGFNPIEDVTAKFSWTGLWNDKDLARQAGSPTPGNASISFSNPDGTSVTKAVTSNTQLGNEFDAVFTYAYTEDVQFGLNLGWFFPGNVFAESNDDVAKQALANVSVNF